ncbi:MAG TPA: hypothetical protein VFQ53_06585 [Kofleriaceae bacterium]|nr:hypothetical protein [Kofleriaceae bacterium]
MRRLAFLMLTVAACGGNDNDSLTSFDGVYTVSTWTDNLTSCAAEGSSVLDQREPNFYIKTENFLGVRFVNVVTCADVGDCQAKANEVDTIHLGGFGFDTGSDETGWRDTSAFGFASNGMCEGTVTETVMTSPASGQIRIEARSTDAAPFPVNAAGECPDDAVISAAAGQPCTSFEVVTASFTTDY